MTDGAGVTRNSELNAKNKFREAALSARAPCLDLQKFILAHDINVAAIYRMQNRSYR